MGLVAAVSYGQETPPLSKPHSVHMAREALDWEGWFTIALFIITFAALVKEIRPPDITMLISSGILVIVGILTPKDFLLGFSNDIIVTIAMLCIVVRTMEVNGILEVVGRKILSSSKIFFRQVVSYMVPVAAGSAFMNNIPIVLLMTPIIRRWCIKQELTPSKYLIPLSYAAILGGVCTIIGTSTNLIVEGLIRKHSPESAISFFELSKIGIPCAIAGIVYVGVFGRYLLPERPDPTSAVAEDTREFSAEFLVEEECPLANKRIQDVRGKHFREQLLVQIERNNVVIDSPGPDFVIFVGDRLVFVGDINQIAELHAIKGLQSQADPHFKLDVSSSHFSEVVISTTSLLIGKTLKSINFRTNYGASVLAVYRQGWRVPGNVGDITLQAGDTLMLLSGESWHGGDYYTKDFYYIRHNEKLIVFNPWRVALILIAVISMITAATMGIPIMIASMAAVFVMIASRSISVREAQNSIIWNLLLLIACSYAFGKAMEVTGVAAYFAEILLSVVGTTPYMLIGGILFITILATELITNTAAALILFPIAIQAISLAGYEGSSTIKTAGVAIAVGCSCCFSIPTGYQTHMIVYGPGGYKFTDFMKVGIPLDLIVWTIATILIPQIWPLTSEILGS